MTNTTSAKMIIEPTVAPTMLPKYTKMKHEVTCIILISPILLVSGGDVGVTKEDVCLYMSIMCYKTNLW